MNKWSFQNTAISNIANGFSQKSDSRLLLIIPTGGGKTLTAIRSIDKMIKNGIIDSNNKCLWITHLKTLKDQTIRVRDNAEKLDFIEDFNFSSKLKKYLDIQMIKSAKNIIDSDEGRSYKYIIIDECHHSSANSYDTFFEKRRLGILGLTATPKRLDKKILKFDKTIYQITPNKLENLDVIVKPHHIEKPLSFTINASDLDSNKFDFPDRNIKIVNDIVKRRSKSKIEEINRFNKVVIYVNTIQHAKNLCLKFNEIKSEKLNELFDFGVHFIHGSGNSLKISNEEFLNRYKKSNSGIIINVNVLSEGFDDPSINTIVMAVPTGSLVQYIQRVGRAIRVGDKKNIKKNPPIVLEFTDELPNIRNKMSFGWLFADISDDLEPELVTINIKAIPNIFTKYYSKILQMKLKEKIKVFGKSLKKLDLGDIIIENSEDINRTNLFLYASVKDLNISDLKWNTLIISSIEKEKFVYVFNNLNNAIINNVSASLFFFDVHPDFKDLKYLDTPEKQMNLYNAMNFKKNELQKNNETNRLIYYTFNIEEEYISFFKKILNFLKYFKSLYLDKH